MNDDTSPLHSLTAEQQADDRLVHALLLHVHDGEASVHREQRVAHAMQRIELDQPEPRSSAADSAGSPPVRLRISNWIRRSALAAAAIILVALGLYLVLHAPSPAMASLNDILGSLARPGDRTFRLQVHPPDADSSQRPGLDQATLYLRDGRQYLLVRKDPQGGDALDGYDGQQSWRIRAGVLVETREGPGAGGLPMPQLMADMPHVDLPRTLQSVQDDYTIERFDDTALPGGKDSVRHILARRKSTLVRGPETVEIWADRKTGLPRRIVFDKAKFQGSTEPRQLVFELTSDSPLSAGWFTPPPHLQN